VAHRRCLQALAQRVAALDDALQQIDRAGLGQNLVCGGQGLQA
jgi:hypothetical protein